MVPTARFKAQIVCVQTFSAEFWQILRRVKQNHDRFIVSPSADPAAIIIGVDEYLRQFVKRPLGAGSALRRDAKVKGLNKLTLRDINRFITETRRDRCRRAHRYSVDSSSAS